MKVETGKYYRFNNGFIGKCIAVWEQEIFNCYATIAFTVGVSNLRTDNTSDDSRHAGGIICEVQYHTVWVTLYSGGQAYVHYSEERAKREDSVFGIPLKVEKIEWSEDVK